MNFLGIGGLELVLIAIVAFLVVGPKRLSEGARTAAKVLRELRRQRDELTGMVREAVDLEGMQADMDDLSARIQRAAHSGHSQVRDGRCSSRQKRARTGRA